MRFPSVSHTIRAPNGLYLCERCGVYSSDAAHACAPDARIAPVFLLLDEFAGIHRELRSIRKLMAVREDRDRVGDSTPKRDAKNEGPVPEPA